jgi:flavin-dependent dehydrogenase
MLNPEGGGWHVDRVCFDRALVHRVQNLGVTVVPGRILSCRQVSEPGKPSVAHRVGYEENPAADVKQMTAKWLVDASGKHAVIAKRYGVQRVRLDTQMAAVAWLQPPTADRDDTTRIKSTENGWWYSARLPDGSRVLAFFTEPQQAANYAKLPGHFVQAANRSQVLPDPVSESAILNGVSVVNAGVSRLGRAVGDGWLAVGDAALSFDPLSSQGMFFALFSGIRGADSIIATDRKADVDHLRVYQQKLDRVFDAHQQARFYHYSTELRFAASPYWQQRLRGVQRRPL